MFKPICFFFFFVFIGYNQGPFTTQQTPVISCQESTSEDQLYHQIMQDAMCYAPTLTRDIDLPMLDETFELSEHNLTSPPPAGIHRRSYILATRQDSSKGRNNTYAFRNSCKIFYLPSLLKLIAR